MSVQRIAKKRALFDGVIQREVRVRKCVCGRSSNHERGIILFVESR